MNSKFLLIVAALCTFTEIASAVKAPSSLSSKPASSSAARLAPPNPVCTEEGYKRDPLDCGAFYYCLPNNGGFVPLRQECNLGLVFDEEKNLCNYPSLVDLVGCILLPL